MTTPGEKAAATGRRRSAAKQAAVTKKRSVAGKKAAATKKRNAAATKAALTKKRSAAATKAARTKKQSAAAKKAAPTKKRRVAARKAVATRRSPKQGGVDRLPTKTESKPSSFDWQATCTAIRLLRRFEGGELFSALRGSRPVLVSDESTLGDLFPEIDGESIDILEFRSSADRSRYLRARFP